MRHEYNIIFVDWAILAPGPCYVNVVHNTKHVGACVAQLVERILEMGTTDMHIIGFSLGAQLANYVARNLGSFQLPRITGWYIAEKIFQSKVHLKPIFSFLNVIFLKVFRLPYTLQ